MGKAMAKELKYFYGKENFKTISLAFYSILIIRNSGSYIQMLKKM